MRQTLKKNKKIKTYNYTFTLPKATSNINTVIHKTLITNQTIIPIIETNFKQFNKKFNTTIHKNNQFKTSKGNNIALLNECKNLFKSLKIDPKNQQYTQIIQKTPTNKFIGLHNNNKLYTNTFYTGAIAKYEGKPSKSFFNQAFCNQLIIDQNCKITSSNQYAYLTFIPNNKHKFKFIFTNQSSTTLYNEHLKNISLLNFTTDIISSIPQIDIINDFNHTLTYTLSTYTDNNGFITNNYGFYFKYINSWKKKNAQFINQLTIDIDFHNETDINILNQQKQNIINTMYVSPLKPTLCEHSLRGAHLVYRFPNSTKLSLQDTNLISILLRFYLQHHHQLSGIDNEATGAQRLTREIFGFQISSINQQQYYCFNYPIFWETNSIYNPNKLLHFLFNYINQFKYDFLSSNFYKEFKHFHNEISSIIHKYKYQKYITNLINYYSTYNTNFSPKTKNNTKQNTKTSKHIFAKITTNTNISNNNSAYLITLYRNLIHQEQQLLLSLKQNNNSKNNSKNISKTSIQEQITSIRNQKNLVNYQMMLNNPLKPQNFKFNILNDLYNENWPTIKQTLNIPTSKLASQPFFTINDIYNEIRNKFQNFFKTLLPTANFHTTSSSPFYADNTPSCQLTTSHFNHFSAYPSGDIITLMIWIIVSKNYIQFINIPIEDGLKQATNMAILSLAKLLSIPITKNIHTTYKKLDFLYVNKLYEQTKTNPALTSAVTKPFNINYNQHYFVQNMYQKNEHNINISTISNQINNYDQAVKQHSEELIKIHRNQDYLTMINNLDYLPIHFFKYLDSANQTLMAIKPYIKRINFNTLTDITHYIIKLAFTNAYNNFIFSTNNYQFNNSQKIQQLNKFFSQQNQISITQIQNDLHLKPTTIKTYTKFLFNIGFFTRQTHINDINNSKYKRYKKQNHNLANFISLVNLDLYKIKIIHTTQILANYANNHKKTLLKLTTVDIVKALDFNSTRKIYSNNLIIQQFKNLNHPFTTDIQNFLKRQKTFFNNTNLKNNIKNFNSLNTHNQNNIKYQILSLYNNNLENILLDKFYLKTSNGKTISKQNHNNKLLSWNSLSKNIFLFDLFKDHYNNIYINKDLNTIKSLFNLYKNSNINLYNQCIDAFNAFNTFLLLI